MPTTARRGERDYIFQRAGSVNWWLKLRRPGGRRIEKSLHTTDRRQAEINAAPLIAAHKQAVLANRLHYEVTTARLYEPGLHDLPDRRRVMATETELLYLDAAGKVTAREPNTIRQFEIAGAPLTVRTLADASQEAFGEPRPVPVKKEPHRDDGLIESYIAHASLSGYPAKEARDVWELYKQLSSNKPLREATRDDGRTLAQHFTDKGIKRATVFRKLVPLVAAVNLAIEEGKLPADQINPFAKVLPKPTKDEKKAEQAGSRLPLSDDDMALLRANLHTLKPRERLLFKLLATTGMRLGEAYEIEGEAAESGIRYVTIGTKTDASRRNVPLPAAVLPDLPKRISGKLFGNDPRRGGKRLARLLRDNGITDPRKVIHSLRHRAATKLAMAECPDGIRWALLGHAGGRKEAGSAGGYVHYPIKQLKRWIEVIGW